MAITLKDFGRIAQTQPDRASIDKDPTGNDPLRATPKGLGHRIAGVFKNAFKSRSAIDAQAQPKQQLADQFRSELRAKFGNDAANRALDRVSINPMRSLKVEHVRKGLGGAAAEAMAQSVPARMRDSLMKGEACTYKGRLPADVEANAIERLGGMSQEITGGQVSQPPGRPALAKAFYKDHVTCADPIEIAVGGRTRTFTHDSNPDPVDALAAFAGSPQRAEGLSHLMHQGAMATLVGARFELLANSSGLPVFRGGSEDRSYKLSQDRNGDYVIDYTLNMQPNQLLGGGGSVPLDSTRSHINLSMQIRITAADLDAGNGHFTITRPPTVDDMRLTPHWGRLAG